MTQFRWRKGLLGGAVAGAALILSPWSFTYEHGGGLTVVAAKALAQGRSDDARGNNNAGGNGGGNAGGNDGGGNAGGGA